MTMKVVGSKCILHNTSIYLFISSPWLPNVVKMLRMIMMRILEAMKKVYVIYIFLIKGPQLLASADGFRVKKVCCTFGEKYHLLCSLLLFYVYCNLFY